MTGRRLLDTRYYRHRPKARAKLYRRTYGRLAYYRKALRARRGLGMLAALRALIAAFFVAKTAHRYRPLVDTRQTDVTPLGRVSRPRRRVYHAGGRKLGGFTSALRHRFAQTAKERFGLDVLGPDGRPDPTTVRLMRNARKLERQRVAR